MRETKRDERHSANELLFWGFLTETAGLALGLEQAEDVVNLDCGAEEYCISDVGSWDCIAVPKKIPSFVAESSILNIESSSFIFQILPGKNSKEIEIAYLGPSRYG